MRRRPSSFGARLPAAMTALGYAVTKYYEFK
jgi:hypothetical protein